MAAARRTFSSGRVTSKRSRSLCTSYKRRLPRSSAQFLLANKFERRLRSAFTQLPCSAKLRRRVGPLDCAAADLPNAPREFAGKCHLSLPTSRSRQTSTRGKHNRGSWSYLGVQFSLVLPCPAGRTARVSGI